MFSILFYLLPFAIEQSLLLRQFFLHVGEHLEELGFINRWQVDVSGRPLRRHVASIFFDGVEAPWVNNISSGGHRFTPRGGHFASVNYFFGVMTWWRGFLNMCLVRKKKFKRGDLDLN